MTDGVIYSFLWKFNLISNHVSYVTNDEVFMFTSENLVNKMTYEVWNVRHHWE